MKEMETQFVINITMEAQMEINGTYVSSDPKLELFDDIDFIDDMVSFLPSQALKDKLTVGYMNFEFQPETDMLYAVLEYIAKEELTETELNQLKSFVNLETNVHGGVFNMDDVALGKDEEDTSMYLSLHNKDKMMKIIQWKE